ncbi:hypothetical protein [Mycobacterium montefiorense]|uniref:hypothetical protein n=1 Tax=Mycobacterium montefiorense TaxID=154654 RepID=UPI0021F350FC|nr:hypothetical protein [Mycobacterium montefiorense]MCV7428059.1 hypothetical protein [Mycobacterium montefiorense]
MTTNPAADMTLDEFEAATQAAKDILRRRVDEIQQARDEQPERLAEARSRADEARGWALIEEPFEGQIQTMSSTDGAATLALPNITARELWGARLAFDLLDCGDDFDQIDAVISRLFSAASGDTGITMVVMAAALSTIASLVVPQLLDEIEHSASNYDERVRLSEARAKAWNGRVSEIRELNKGLGEMGVKPVDGFDLGANALDPDSGDALG